MRFIKILFLVFISVNVAGQVIPKPDSITLKGDSINLNEYFIDAVLISDKPNNFFKYYFNYNFEGFGKESLKNNKYCIIVAEDTLFSNNEQYQLEISNLEPSPKISIMGSPNGIFHGLQTLRQLIFQSNGKLQCQTIIDSPAFKWRGMHLDVCRHFFDVDFIKKYIDMLALHKMNTFHWHLTEDQGWRIEIKKYPKLTEIGSKRKETIIGKNFDPYKGDGKAYGGFYTQEEIKDVVKYAADRYITVIPEIEMPGHAVAALSAYPQFSCRQKPLEPLTKWGISDDIYCSKDETFEFLFNIMDEVLELFPSKYIHIGGDEAPKTRWKECDHCQANIKKHNLKDEHELQSYFIGRMDSFLISKGRKMIGWDEILEGGLAENAAVMSWRGEKGGIAAAQQKHHVVMSPGSHCYFDHYQGYKKDEPLAIGGYTTLKKVYSYNPAPAKLEKQYEKYIMGAQGNVWTEYMATPEHVMYMALPRMCALSEVLWSGPGTSSYHDFTNRLIPHFNLLDSLKYNYSKALFNIYTLDIIADGKLHVSLESDFPEYEIRYTTDGTEPNGQSAIFKRPIVVIGDINLKARHFKNGKANGNTLSKEYKHHIGLGKKVKLKIKPSEHYNTGGAQTLVNGIVGSLPWSGNEWLGWRGEEMYLTIDLGKKTKVNKIKISFLEAKESWIHFPKEVKMEDTRRSADYFEINEFPLSYKNGLYETQDNLNLEKRYLVIRAIPQKSIPDGSPGSGNLAWLFCSEIIVE